MKDQFGRSIEYMRISITDRCNLRCFYCMPEERAHLPHEEILGYEEILRVADIAAQLGISKFRITGGEPLVRRGSAGFAAALKGLPGVSSVTLTTNGLLLAEHLLALAEAGIDGINISLDAVHEETYERITGAKGARTAIEAARASCELGIATRINAVLLEENREEWEGIMKIAEDMPADVRFIERMPIGCLPERFSPVAAPAVIELARRRYPDLHRDTARGIGPAAYWKSDRLQGRLGIIAADSEPFCSSCNRVRLTSTGRLRGCLGSARETELRDRMRAGASDDELLGILREAVFRKPEGHTFGTESEENPVLFMNQIGG